MKSFVLLAVVFVCLTQWSRTSASVHYIASMRMVHDSASSGESRPLRESATTDDWPYIRTDIKGWSPILIPCNESECCYQTYHYCCDSGRRCCDFLGRRSVPSKCTKAK